MLFDLNKVWNDNKKREQLQKTIYDYVIIGSGPAGIIFCNEILKKKHSKNILIIEKGDLIQNKFEKISYKFLPIKLTSRAFAIGGTGNIWSNISSSFEDFEMKQRWKRKYINLWPLNFSQLKNFYNKIDKKLGFDYEDLEKNKIEIPFQIRKFYGLNKPTNFRDHIPYKKINILYNCEVFTIDEIDKESFVTFKYQNYLNKIYGKKIIICTGGLESTSLILRSLQNKKLNTIRNKKFIGSYFMDHPKFILGHLKYPKTYLINKFLIINNKNKFSYFGISLQKHIQKNKKLLNSYVRFEKERLHFDPKKKYIFFLHLAKLLYYKIFGIKNNTYKIRIRVFSEMVPRLNNKIIFNKKNQKISVNYRLCSVSIKTLKYLSSSIYRYFSYHPEKENPNKITKRFIYNNIEDASHHMGGLFYSKNKKECVVDKNLRIVGTSNIFVCSSSVFPTSGSANPTMTVCAMAIRLACFLSKIN
jgi:hypothetical protein